LRFRTCSLLVAVLLGSAAWAADWPQFGGTDARNMVSAEKDLPEALLAAGGKEFVHLKWSAKLGNKSYGTPTIAAGRVFVGTNNGSPRDPRYKGDRGVEMCLDEKSGEVIWTLPVPKFKGIKSFDLAGLGICSSAAVEGERAYIMTNRCEILSLNVHGMAGGNVGPFKDEAEYLKAPPESPAIAPTTKGAAKGAKKPDAAAGPATAATAAATSTTATQTATLPAPATDADIIWRLDLIKELDISPHDATDCSLLIHGDLLFTCSNNGVNKGHKVSDNPDAPTLLAIDKHTGALVACDDCLISRRVFHGNWSSPSLAMVKGQAAVLLGGGDGFLYAFDPVPLPGKDGKVGVIRKIWSADCNPPEHKGKPYKDKLGPSEVIGTPVCVEGRIYVAVGQDPNHGQGTGNLSCFEADTGKLLWNDPTISRSLSTVSVAGGLLFVGDFSGRVSCYDAVTGKKHWEHNTESAIWGSTLVADGKVYVGNTGGVVTVLAAAAEKKVLSEAKFSAAIQCSPVAANGTLYIMTHTNLYAFSMNVSAARNDR
jgi:outer membrane protein assembly factor BamB